MESVNITEKSSRILSTGIRKNAENTENNNSKPEIIEVVSCTPDTDGNLFVKILVCCTERKTCCFIHKFLIHDRFLIKEK